MATYQIIIEIMLFIMLFHSLILNTPMILQEAESNPWVLLYYTIPYFLFLSSNLAKWLFIYSFIDLIDWSFILREVELIIIKLQIF